MCGRYASSRSPDDLAEVFEVDEVEPGPDGAPLPPAWNVAPTTTVHAVLERAARDRPGSPVLRRLRPVRWGLVPSWSRGPGSAPLMINARLETAAVKPAFRRALALRRCLLPADGWYEWSPGAGGARTPHFLHDRDGAVLAMAGLYEWWHDPSRPRDDPAGWLCSAAIITTSAVDELGRLHDRMPVLVPPGHWSAWLDPATADPEVARSLLAPPPPGSIAAHPVSRAVGDVRSAGPQLVAPLPEGLVAEPAGTIPL